MESLINKVNLSDEPKKPESTLLCEPDYGLSVNLNYLFDYNLNNRLNITKKETLLWLIQKSHKNNIISPFDQHAYSKLVKDKCNLVKRSPELNYNYESISKINNILKKLDYNLNSKRFLNANNLLCNCVSSSLMVFFFDLFRISEIQSFDEETINIMIKLKSAYKPQKYLNPRILFEYLAENVLWNSLVLYKYRLDDWEKNKMGYFNFYLSYIYILIHMELIVLCDKAKPVVLDYLNKKINDLNSALPNFLKALILNGLLKQDDITKFENFIINNKLNRLKCARKLDIKYIYFEKALACVSNKAGLSFPLRLKDLCRIRVKESVQSYEPSKIFKLSLNDDKLKGFLMFDQEIVSY